MESQKRRYLPNSAQKTERKSALIFTRPTLNTGGRTYGYVGTEEAPGENYGKAKYVLQND